MRGIDGYFLANRRISVEEISDAFDQMFKWEPKNRRQPRDIEKSRKQHRR